MRARFLVLAMSEDDENDLGLANRENQARQTLFVLTIQHHTSVYMLYTYPLIHSSYYLY